MASFVALAAALLAVTEDPADVGGTSVRLEWSAPEECPDEATLRAWVDDLAPVAGTAIAKGTIDRDGVDFVLALEVDAADDTARTLRAPDCMVLGRAAAVVIAVSLDPIAVAQSAPVATAMTTDVPEPPALELPPVAAPPIATPRVSALPPLDRPAPAIEYGASLGVGVEGLLLPSVGPGFAIAPFVGTRRVHVEAPVQYWTPRTTSTASTGDVRARLQMVTAGVRACPILERGRVRFPLCAGVDAGVLLARAIGDDVRNPSPASEPWAGVVLAPGVRVAVAPRVSLGVAIEGVISLYLPRFGVVGLDRDLYQMGRGGLRGAFYVQLHGPLQKK